MRKATHTIRREWPVGAGVSVHVSIPCDGRGAVCMSLDDIAAVRVYLQLLEQEVAFANRRRDAGPDGALGFVQAMAVFRRAPVVDDFDDEPAPTCCPTCWRPMGTP